MLVEAEIGPCEHLGQKYDLAGVHRKMLYHMEDTFEHGHIVMLNDDALRQTLDGHFLYDLYRFLHRGSQPPFQFGNGDARTRVEFSVALPRVRQPSDAGNNPLAHVSA